MAGGSSGVDASGEVETRVDRSVVDALLYGIMEGLGFMKEEGEALRRSIGGHMLDYLIKSGDNGTSPKLEAAAGTLRAILSSNGLEGAGELIIEGSDSAPSAPNLIEYLWGAMGRPSLTGETAGPPRPQKVDWVILEMLLYGMTRSLDFLGAQGQILINRIGTQMLKYLTTTGNIEWSDDPLELIDREEAYFIKAGFAVKISTDTPKPFRGGTLEFTYVGSPYHTRVLTRLRNEGSLLYSCPPCVVACSILKKDGWTARFDAGYGVLKNGTVVLRHRLDPPRDTFSEEMEGEALQGKQA